MPSDMIFFALFLRSRCLPAAIAWLGIVGSPFLAAATIVMFVSGGRNSFVRTIRGAGRLNLSFGRHPSPWAR